MTDDGVGTLSSAVTKPKMAIVIFAAPIFIFLISLASPHAVSGQDIAALQAGVVRITAQSAEGGRGIGTGFIVRLEEDRAYIVTAAHVIDSDPHPKVEFFTKANAPVQSSVVHKEIGDDVTSLALLMVEGKEQLPPGATALPLASGIHLSGGEDIIVIGFPRGAGPWALFKGSVVSRQGRYMTFDANIDEGNSGGPLIHNGQVVGLVAGTTRYGLGVTGTSVRDYLEGHRVVPQEAMPRAKEASFRRIYYEDFAVDSLTDTELANRLGNIWQVGVEPSADWEGRIENGTYRLCNAKKSRTASFTNRLRYYANPTDASPQRLNDSKVTVKIRVEPPYEMHSGAGIRYRSPKADGDYYAFVLNGGNNVSLLRRIGRELRYLWSGETSTSSDHELTSLKIIGHGAELQLYVNEKLVHTERNVDLLEGDPGIMAYSIGCFVFDDFAIYHRTSEGGPS